MFPHWRTYKINNPEENKSNFIFIFKQKRVSSLKTIDTCKHDIKALICICKKHNCIHFSISFSIFLVIELSISKEKF